MKKEKKIENMLPGKENCRGWKRRRRVLLGKALRRKKKVINGMKRRRTETIKERKEQTELKKKWSSTE